MSSRPLSASAPRPRPRQLLLETATVLALLLAVGGVALAFAWPWLPRVQYAGASIARYAPLRNGDSFLLAKYDPSGAITGWESQNLAVVGGLRALSIELRKAPRDAISAFYTGGDPNVDTLAALADVDIVEVRSRELDREGTLKSFSSTLLREPRGEFHVGFSYPDQDEDLLFDPPLQTAPAVLEPGATWDGAGQIGALRYSARGRVVDRGPRPSRWGEQPDCVQLELRLTLAQGEQVTADFVNSGWYCAELGYLEGQELDAAAGELRSRTVVLANRGLRAEPDELPPLLPLAESAESPNLDDPAAWELTRVGRARFSGDSADSTIPPTWVPSDPPLVLAAGYDGDLVAFDAGDPATPIVWRFHTGGTVYGAPAFDPARGYLYFGASDKRLYCVDARGMFIWHYQARDNVAGRPLIVDEPSADSEQTLVIFGSEDGTVSALDAANGQPRWTAATNAPVVAWPALAGGVVVVGNDDGRVYGLDPATGDERWLYAMDGALEAPIVAADETVYLVDRGGNLAALDATSGDEQWVAEVGGVLRNAPAVGDEALYVVSSTGRVAAVSREDGSLLWETVEQPYVGTPLLAGEVLLVTADDGNVYRLGLDGQRQGSWAISSASTPTDSAGAFFKLGPTLGGGAVWLADSNAVVRRLGPPDRAAGDGPAAARLQLTWAANPLQPPFQGGFTSVTPVEYDGRALVLDDSRNLHLVDPTTGRATALGAIAGDGSVVIEPVVADDTLLAIVGQTLHAVELPSGRPRWRFDGGGTSLRPVAVADGTAVWLVHRGQTAPGEAGMLYALDLASGQLRWQAPLDGISLAGGAVIRAGVVFVSTPAAAFDLASGRPRWQATLDGSPLAGPVLSESGDTLFVAAIAADGNGGQVVALDTASGRPRWQADLAGAAPSPVERLWLSGDTLVVPGLQGPLIALDAASGAERWRFVPPAPRLGAVTVHGDRVMLMLKNANVLALDVASGRPAARFKDLEFNFGSVRALTQRPAVVGGTVLAPMSAFLLGFETPAE